MRRFSQVMRKHSQPTYDEPTQLNSPTDLEDSRFMPTPYTTQTHSRRATVAGDRRDALAELERELAATSIRRSASHNYGGPAPPPSYTTATTSGRGEQPMFRTAEDRPRRGSEATRSSPRSSPRQPLPTIPAEPAVEESSTE